MKRILLLIIIIVCFSGCETVQVNNIHASSIGSDSYTLEKTPMVVKDIRLHADPRYASYYITTYWNHDQIELIDTVYRFQVGDVIDFYKVK